MCSRNCCLIFARRYLSLGMWRRRQFQKGRVLHDTSCLIHPVFSRTSKESDDMRLCEQFKPTVQSLCPQNHRVRLYGCTDGQTNLSQRRYRSSCQQVVACVAALMVTRDCPTRNPAHGIQVSPIKDLESPTHTASFHPTRHCNHRNSFS